MRHLSFDNLKLSVQSYNHVHFGKKKAIHVHTHIQDQQETENRRKIYMNLHLHNVQVIAIKCSLIKQFLNKIFIKGVNG